MRVKPTERKAIAAVLEQDHETAEAAAEAVIVALEELRRDDRKLCIVRWEGFPLVVGPFSTENQVRKALQKGLGGPKWTAGYLRTPESIEAVRAASEDVTGALVCPSCHHPKVAHMNQKWKAQGEREWRSPGCICGHCEEKF